MQRRMWQRGPEGEIIRVRAEPVSSSTTAGQVTGQQAHSRRAALSLALRLGFRDTYDYLGALLVLSLVWTLLSGMGAVGGQALALSALRAVPPRALGLLSTVAGLAGLVIVGAPLVGGIFR